MATATALPKTDYSRWRLKTHEGRQTWHYLETDEQLAAWPQATYDKYHLGLDTNLPKLPEASTALEAARNGLRFFSKLQLPEGQWACEYGGPMFLLPGLIISYYVTNTPIPEPWRIEITNYLCARANPVDGGWGLHIEGESSVFGTSLNYVVLRILGMDPDHPVAQKARNRLHELGGALGSPHWGKFWLALIGCYSWEGMNPVPPEMWCLPNWVPFHPWRWWVHTRQVYLPMSYMYSLKYSHPENDLTRSLREELYTQDYASIQFSQHRNTVAPLDIYHPHSPILDVANEVLTMWGNWACPKFVQSYARRHVYDLICREDENTLYCCLGPVNNPLNFIARYLTEGEGSHAVKMHRETLKEFLWMKHEGMLMNGTDGVQTWDTSFLVQAVVECELTQEAEFKEMLIKALEFLENQQIRENCPEMDKCYRQQRKGAWAFSKKSQGYTVSDCTAEGLKAVLMLQTTPDMPKLVSDRRCMDAVDVMLTMQNADGGFASYEPIRAGSWLEHLNAAEVFGKIMVEYSYPECTTAVVTALALFREHFPSYRSHEIESTIRRAIGFIKSAQRADGSWYGAWGICFNYANMFALESLALIGEVWENSSVARKACEFILSKQMDDGGWGESYLSSVKGEYIHHKHSQVVNTAWACIALMNAKYPHKEPIERGINLLRSRQQQNGEWLQEAIEGVFNKSCMISYPNYKNVFSIKALGMFARHYEGKE
ncbi:terpenoid cyclases/protein prenyltransferase alpha-alpha toroid [Sphaerosporella brunnea]|uniref:Terpene cyclase/mutase family member n=1 Tax=Sphaerosporella brunnea TaxID=1250544 RepID=A0A5J5F6P7_9PEZI|nr:terpenoid cyclases/protein prenyltransferase alpha-alpha toroid [Sphaerosporella brunnea]